MPRDQRDPQLLGEMLLKYIEVWKRRSGQDCDPYPGPARTYDTFSFDGRGPLNSVPDFDATHQGPIEKYGDPRK